MIELKPDASLGTLIEELYIKPTGLSLAQAAKLCALSEAELAGIIRGELPMSHKRALALSRGFNTHISFFQRYISTQPK